MNLLTHTCMYTHTQQISILKQQLTRTKSFPHSHSMNGLFSKVFSYKGHRSTKYMNHSYRISSISATFYAEYHSHLKINSAYETLSHLLPSNLIYHLQAKVGYTATQQSEWLPFTEYQPASKTDHHSWHTSSPHGEPTHVVCVITLHKCRNGKTELSPQGTLAVTETRQQAPVLPSPWAGEMGSFKQSAENCTWHTTNTPGMLAIFPVSLKLHHFHLTWRHCEERKVVKESTKERRTSVKRTYFQDKKSKPWERMLQISF